jgi:adenylate kinase family enzyme
MQKTLSQPLPQRILIVGCGGAGKSTLAQQIGERLSLPVVHLDSIYWSPGWVETEKEAWLARLQEELSRPQWVMDGNYGATLEERLKHADALIYLDYPRWICLYRVVSRYIKHRGKTRPDMGPECPEQLDWVFLKWIWGYNKTRRPALLAKLDGTTGSTQIIRLQRPREAADFLTAIADSL